MRSGSSSNTNSHFIKRLGHKKQCVSTKTPEIQLNVNRHSSKPPRNSHGRNKHKPDLLFKQDTFDNKHHLLELIHCKQQENDALHIRVADLEYKYFNNEFQILQYLYFNNEIT